MKPLVIKQKTTARESESFKKYLSEVSKLPLLDKDEEVEVAIKAAAGDERAINKLVEGNLRFVVSVAKQFSNSKVTLEDLVNEGNYGLIEAAHKFDHTRGFKFISFAVWHIRRRVMEYKNNNSTSIRIPVNRIQELSKFNERMLGVEQRLGRTPDFNDMVNAYDGEFSADEIDFWLKIKSTDIWSLDKPLSDGDSGSGSLIDLLENNDAQQADINYLTDERTRLINFGLDVLTALQKTVIERVYGLNGKTELSIKDIAQLEGVGISSERVRQVRDRALRILRARHKNNLLKRLDR